MNEMQPDHATPEQPQAPTNKNDPRGSIASGIGLSIVILILGHIVMAMVGSLVAGIDAEWSTNLAMVLMAVPEIVFVVFVVRAYAQGRSRTGTGLLLGLAALLGVILLLVAACFGLLMIGGH